jgi:Tol biopolymer transport system component
MRYLFLLILLIILSSLSVLFAQDIPSGDVPICKPEANPTPPSDNNQLLYISAGFEPNFDGGGEGETEPIWGDVEAERNVFLVDTETGSKRKIADGFSWAKWSPDGQQLILERNTGISEDLYLLDLREETEPELLISSANVYGENAYRINAVNWLSDGQKIIFSLDQLDLLKSETDHKAGIYVFNLKTKQMQPLLMNDTLGARNPAVSPDETQIAFLGFAANSPFSTHLYIMNIDGSNPHQLLDSEIFDGPVWSPDSKEIGYRILEPEPALYAINVDNHTERFLAHSSIGSFWSPVDQYILWSPLSANKRIYRMNVDGSGSCSLANHEPELQSLSEEYNTDHSGLTVSFGGITWSTHADKLAYALDIRVYYFEPKTGQFLGEEPVDSQLWIMDRNGTDRRLLLSESVNQLVWRPKV